MDLQDYLHGEYAIAIMGYEYNTVSQPGFYSTEYRYYDDYDVMSYKEAMQKIEELDGEVYVLRHNEYSRPDYIIVDANSAGWVFGGRNGDMSNYDWDDAECDCGECNVCIDMMNKQDTEYIETIGKEIFEEYKLLKDRLKNERGENIEIEEIDNYTGKIIEQDIGTYYIKKGRIHRADGPAIEWAEGTKEWYKNDKLHRENGPAIECANGTKKWYKEGKLHREDGPAIEYHGGYLDGTKEWWKEGKLHRADGPAEEWADGTKHWYKKGKLHREDGPAVE